MKINFAPLIILALISGCSKEPSQQAASTTTATAQCMKDTDCKGDRICEVGICTAPQSNATPTVSNNSLAIEPKNGGLEEFKLSSESGTDAQCVEGVKDAPAFGSSFNGGVFLCREPIEIYWNNWYALNITQNSLEIHGEGKTTAFSGHLAIDCNTGTNTWNNATNMEEKLTSKKDIAEIVPIEALKKASQHICKI